MNDHPTGLRLFDEVVQDTLRRHDTYQGAAIGGQQRLRQFIDGWEFLKIETLASPALGAKEGRLGARVSSFILSGDVANGDDFAALRLVFLQCFH